ncbi:pancreatic triacylglycerol lipase isoform X1 [Bos indicus x Bos taurus]|uniref:pancreatic triacylglycerol lipase isoform X1 n=1 Tax=Bos mutus TaxID=72004 RepID=UPI0006D92373|nr:PREDICTED: pancreatic triacylglycerol lipase isoform X1 [Bos mutus]XP_027385021.1 pancreatic triacylglycerol lipase isoform X1 [Bos indicus x Bos taurus]
MLLIWTLSLLLGAVVGKEVCYDRLGCFSDDSPWAGIIERPLKVLPWSPEEVNTRFLLYTNENPNNFQVRTLIEIVADESTIASSNFKTNRKTRFVIHGFIDKGDENWLQSICKNLFSVESVNCICVDWKGGSHTGYTQATQNIRIVGAEVAYLVDVLKSSFEYSLSDVHIIGHSLGAHAAGEAGRRTNGAIGRITGLDPAEPCFEGTPELVRLDPSDAQFVDVIHTDAAPMIPNLGFGMSQVVGHLDFFPNGGKEMPGCKKNALSQIVDIDGIWEGTRDFVACNHLRSYKYYADSILNPDGFAGFPCASYSAFSENKCFPCPSEGCPQMGHYADRFPGKTKSEGQTFYLNTGDAGNFARWRYKVDVTLSGKRVTGHILVSLFGDKGNSKQYEIFNGTLKPDSTESNEFDSDVEVGVLQKVKFLWYNNVINPTLPKVGASKISVEANDGQVFDFCSQDTVREEVLLTLNPC